MKLILMMGFILTSFNLLAVENCPNVSGIYQISDILALEFSQADCTNISQYFRIISKDGQLDPNQGPALLELNLDGTPYCNNLNKCDSAKFTKKGIQFSSNYNQPVKLDDHGRCTHKGYEIVKNSQAQLEVTFKVDRCEDGYTGLAKKVFPLFAL